MLARLHSLAQKIMNMKRLLLAVAAGGGLLAAVHPALAQTWTLTSAPIAYGRVACSADGAKVVASSAYGPIYVSTDSGLTWAETTAPRFSWRAIASSADGIELWAASLTSKYYAGQIYHSTNSGLTWSEAGAPGGDWISVASSADGAKVVAAGGSGTWTSADSGETWTLLAHSPSAPILFSSTDGSQWVAIGFAIYTSTDSGATWTSASVPANQWVAVAGSADGTRLVAAASAAYDPFKGLIYTSSDSGANWVATSAPSNEWASVASSADGTKIVAVARSNYDSQGVDHGGSIYISADSGATWALNDAPATNWLSVASSADGTKLVAVANGGIYTSQTTPHPILNVTPSGTNLLLSWIIPSQPFVLQENADLATTNWTDVASAPVLNLTNLQNQVTVPLSTARRFYRLRAVTD